MLLVFCVAPAAQQSFASLTVRERRENSKSIPGSIAEWTYYRVHTDLTDKRGAACTWLACGIINRSPTPVSAAGVLNCAALHTGVGERFIIPHANHVHARRLNDDQQSPQTIPRFVLRVRIAPMRTVVSSYHSRSVEYVVKIRGSDDGNIGTAGLSL
jgi:hypothetical protein